MSLDFDVMMKMATCLWRSFLHADNLCNYVCQAKSNTSPATAPTSAWVRAVCHINAAVCTGNSVAGHDMTDMATEQLDLPAFKVMCHSTKVKAKERLPLTAICVQSNSFNTSEIILARTAVFIILTSIRDLSGSAQKQIHSPKSAPNVHINSCIGIIHFPGVAVTVITNVLAW